jgi:hypothetical protein
MDRRLLNGADMARSPADGWFRPGHQKAPASFSTAALFSGELDMTAQESLVFDTWNVENLYLPSPNGFGATNQETYDARNAILPGRLPPWRLTASRFRRSASARLPRTWPRQWADGRQDCPGTPTSAASALPS